MVFRIQLEMLLRIQFEMIIITKATNEGRGSCNPAPVQQATSLQLPRHCQSLQEPGLQSITNLHFIEEIWFIERPFCKLKGSSPSSSSAWRARTAGGRGRRRGDETRGLAGANTALWPPAPSQQVSQMRTSEIIGSNKGLDLLPFAI